MHARSFVIASLFALLAFGASRVCYADTESESGPAYTDDYGTQRMMFVTATVNQPAGGSQFWAQAGVADTCYNVTESGEWEWSVISSTGSSDFYDLSGEADTYVSSTGQQWGNVGSFDTGFYLPTNGQPSGGISESYWNTDDFLGNNQQEYGGISYYLQALTGMSDETYYPGFSELVGAANGFNCACSCP